MEKFRSIDHSNLSTEKLVAALKEKKKRLGASDPSHNEIKTAVIFDGGGMRGVFGAGVANALENLGFGDVFDRVYGVSAGSAVGAYFLSKQTDIGTNLFYEELATREFRNPFRVGKILDVGHLRNVFTRGEKQLDQDKVRQARPDLYIGVSHLPTGEGEFVDAKKPGIDMLGWIEASCAHPMIYNQPLRVNGELYADGAIGNELPIARAFRDRFTNILVVLNHPLTHLPQRTNAPEKLLASFMMRKFPESFKSVYRSSHKYYRILDEKIQQHLASDMNIGIIAPKEMPISPISGDVRQMKNIAQKGKEQTIAVFG